MTAALACLESPGLLEEVASGLRAKNVRAARDCAEVMVLVARQRPLLVAPYFDDLRAALESRNARVRWGAMGAIAEIAQFVPMRIESLLPRIESIAVDDRSVSVRDLAVQALGNYAGTGPTAARTVLPLLERAVAVHSGRHAAKALSGLLMAGYHVPELADRIVALARKFESDSRPSVTKAVRRILLQLAGEGRTPPA